MQPEAPQPSTPQAAQEAAAFVQRLFADLHPAAAHDDAAPGEPAQDNAPAASAAPLPADWPAGQDMPGLGGQRVLVLGLGVSGLSMARWALRCGANRVTVLDERAAPPQLPALRSSCAQDWNAGRLHFTCGAFSARALDGGVDCILRSPGLAPQQIAPLQEAAAQQGIALSGEWALFARALAALERPATVLAITGSNGKTTTAALCAHLLRHAGRDVALAGNIGPALLDTLSQRLETRALPDAWVLELSSFQLDDAPPATCLNAATVLNLSADHLDWHGDAAAYARAKARIFASAATCMVLNRDDPAVMHMLPPAAAPEKPVRGRLRAQPPVQRTHVCFGSDAPGRPGDFGLETAGGMRWLVRAGQTDDAADAPPMQRLMPVEALQIRGQHNALNALAALALLHAGCGMPLGALLHGLRSYAGEAHRIQPVARLGRLQYIDDSKGTNVAATVAALEAVGQDFAHVLIILGGEGKGQDFRALRQAVQHHARAAVLLGRDAPCIRAALTGCGLPLMDARDMVDAVRQATAHARHAWPASDVAILLSPACASLDMFANYAERARCFAAAVQELAGEGPDETHDGGNP